MSKIHVFLFYICIVITFQLLMLFYQLMIHYKVFNEIAFNVKRTSSIVEEVD